MLTRLLLVAVVAGGLAGVLAHGVQMLKVTPLIHQAESYEGGHGDHDHDGHAHTQAEATAPGLPEPDDAVWSPADGLERQGVTLLSNVLTGVAFGFLLTAGMALYGREVDIRKGVAWGLAGFAVFSLAPAVGLPPELPGSQAAPVAERQLWWFGTVIATAGGLAAIVMLRHNTLKALGAGLIALPHVLGAPHPHELAPTPLPAELAAQFAVASLITALGFWCVLGGLAGKLYARWVQHR